MGDLAAEWKRMTEVHCQVGFYWLKLNYNNTKI